MDRFTSSVSPAQLSPHDFTIPSNVDRVIAVVDPSTDESGNGNAEVSLIQEPGLILSLDRVIGDHAQFVFDVVP